MSQLVVAPVLVALVAAIATLATAGWPRVRTTISLSGGVAYVLAIAALYRAVWLEGAIVYQLSGWPAPFGISLVADGLSMFFLALGAVVGLGSLLFGLRTIDARGQRLSYHPLHHFVLVGVSGAFLTGDLFNLFVWFEVMLMASYVLVAFYGGVEATRAALTYVALNLVGSAIMLVAIGGLYATTGTLNLADMSRRLATPATYDLAVAPIVGLSALLFVVFALKAGVVPLHFWVAPAYRAAPAPVAALLAGVVKKVGIYAMIRLTFTVFAAPDLTVSIPGVTGTTPLGFFGPVLFLLAVASIVVGGLSALGTDDLDGLLAFSSISQMGFVVLPLAVGATVPAVRELAVAAALVYALNHGVAKALLFLASGTIVETTGTDRLRDLGGIAERIPVLAGSFFLGGLALVGIPPVIGFFGKLYVFETLWIAGANAALGVALIGAVLTLAYLSRAWNRGFWGAPAEAVLDAHRRPDLVAIVGGFAVAVLLLGIGIEPVVAGAEAGARAAVNRGTYIEAVLGGAP